MNEPFRELLSVTSNCGRPSCPYAAAWPLAKELKRLEDAHRELKVRLKLLAHEQRALLLRNSLLHAWCESLSLMQVARSGKSPAQQSELYTQLLHRELGLLHQLANCRYEMCSSLATAAMFHPMATQPALDILVRTHHTSVPSPYRNDESLSYDLSDVLHPGVPTIAPLGDQMAYFRFQISRPPLEAAQTMIAPDLARSVREATLRASLLLHSLEDLPANQQAPIIQQMEQMWSG